LTKVENELKRMADAKEETHKKEATKDMVT
jgi:hypothetical protein